MCLCLQRHHGLISKDHSACKPQEHHCDLSKNSLFVSLFYVLFDFQICCALISADIFLKPYIYVHYIYTSNKFTLKIGNPWAICNLNIYRSIIYGFHVHGVSCGFLLISSKFRIWCISWRFLDFIRGLWA